MLDMGDIRRNKNVLADASASDRIIIEAAPSAPLGSVIIAHPTSDCSSGACEHRDLQSRL
jgi:hypothetical protein